MLVSKCTVEFVFWRAMFHIAHFTVYFQFKGQWGYLSSDNLLMVLIVRIVFFFMLSREIKLLNYEYKDDYLQRNANFFYLFKTL